MAMTAIDIANSEQRAASNPAVSAFTAASAGSGKTKLLTDRLLRLMLGGAGPEKILCLTYTKAAAAEMRIRLNAKLGQWVVLPRPALEAELRALDVTPDEKTLDLARKLFADVLDLPGGMRIETIHAFCQSLLRRFPLEAELSPHFQVADDELAAQRLREAREAALANPAARAAIEVLAAEIDEPSFIALTEDFCKAPQRAALTTEPEAIIAMQRAALGAGDTSAAEIIAQAVHTPHEAELREMFMRIALQGTPTGQAKAQKWLDWLALSAPHRIESWEEWAESFFTTAGEPRKMGPLCGKLLRAVEDDIDAVLARERERIGAVQEQLKAARLAVINEAAVKLLLPIAAAEHGAKTLTAQLTYADLIAHTEKLLVDPGAAWVLYKLDGGIDHLLLDEVQDTAPQQWEIANAIAAEFFAGAGAKDVPRSIFAVGDPKQSIFSFQGADLTSFREYREKFKTQAVAAGQKWLDGKLSVSFRSSAPVLALTDAVFYAGFARQGVYAPGEMPEHVVSRTGQAGRVTLWSLTKARAATELPHWALPDDYESADSAYALLARQLADYIAARLTQPLPSRNRLARPGDFLILVRRRDALVGAITAQLKARGIAVAGLDRMVLTAQTAVQDLLALCDALLLPDDDRAVAHFLASPLGGLSDESLMHLALGRERSLMATLYDKAGQQEDWWAARYFFDSLRQKADFLPPYALLAEALGPLGGRAKLLRRLGAEAAEPLDELLSEALAFTQAEPGSLQGFVQKMRLSGASIKRETEAGGDEVRIMTVHGAKGLQAPIVILPDTTSLPKADKKLFWLDVPQQGGKIPIYCPRTGLRAEAVAQAAAADKEAMQAEYNRLLYVALTRAEDELLICGAEGKRQPPENCWYEAVAQGFARLPARNEEGVLVFDCEQSAAPDRVARVAERHSAPLPAWAGSAPGWKSAPPPKEVAKPERIVPSRAAEEEQKRAIAASPLGPAQGAARTARATAMARGNVIHALLQHLPQLPFSEQRAAARQYLATQEDGIAAQAEGICESVLAVLGNLELHDLFGPASLAEVPLAGVVAGREVGGMVDRLAVTARGIWLADYKSDRAPPATHYGIPEKYIAQLAAYRSILRQIYPDRQIRTLLIWTETGAVMDVPDELLEPATPA
jgi:ATP-dependent helicase/nuclease subunit A